jgi:NAD-dependent SIR2 family protein deacetylase
METDCVNCGDPDAEQYDLMVRNTSHDEVPLCEECHKAISEELADA